MGTKPRQIDHRDILTQLKRRDKPVMTTGDLAEELDVSIQTIRNHIDEVTEYTRVETDTVSGTTVYWYRHDEGDFDHRCQRCGRGVSRTKDHIKIELDPYLTRVKPYDVPKTSFYVICRFCYADIVSWLYRDDGSMGEYPFVDDWDIPESQKEEVKADPEILTDPESNIPEQI